MCAVQQIVIFLNVLCVHSHYIMHCATLWCSVHVHCCIVVRSDDTWDHSCPMFTVNAGSQLSSLMLFPLLTVNAVTQLMLRICQTNGARIACKCGISKRTMQKWTTLTVNATKSALTHFLCLVFADNAGVKSWTRVDIPHGRSMWCGSSAVLLKH